jgi:hypothetical protein
MAQAAFSTALVHYESQGSPPIATAPATPLQAGGYSSSSDARALSGMSVHGHAADRFLPSSSERGMISRPDYSVQTPLLGSAYPATAAQPPLEHGASGTIPGFTAPSSAPLRRNDTERFERDRERERDRDR